MPSDKDRAGVAIIAFDTSGPWLSGAVLQGGQVRAQAEQALPKGQGEALIGFLETLLNEAGLGWADLDALGAGTGPGNFTGIRITTSAARGLALGLGIPAIGVDRFTALALDGPDLPVVLPAMRGAVWIRETPEATPVQSDSPPAFYIGEGGTPPAHPLAVAIARIAAARMDTPQPRPAPAYLRAPDAAPPSERPPALLD
ncbi:tRNA (adenosine(37)-N6)-threonylcarbamoyltransferase complex dimerization subunit type 1 TsaB [Rhodobacter sp. NTK016B]|uniref:tRNA (adenosine(37)-N6)-threonylcarbamoyltransferase complex dimerization subunit type 1 TsaB n=1 Tax=Rhodobacter sp. NTK016B TaxID=2759676 RepID=UPI001A8CDB13|nr:tRNA (adenosine(37)-N6)-threonylcarbamoyltransferase complex dimerization subunit type 1 TsaB [Rhodobacter sp. NTK016B]MBN8290748.1 tRNA (adenosine(37)-N6)-threonylcarbamoyltransferase complex dimerization subunit type 1 TsaB [Rhodobacter sp. NTK016B]